MPDEVDFKPKAKHRKSTCAGCRRRKSKCDGKTPKCTTCIAYKDECHYDKPPSLAYVRSLEEEVQELKAQLRQTKAQFWLGKAGSQEDKKHTISSPASDAAGSQGSSQQANLAHRNRAAKWEADISVDDNGSVTFHNSTSAIHEGVPIGQQVQSAAHAESLSPNGQIHERMRLNLIMNADHQRQIEPLAIANAAPTTSVPKELSQELLKYHWCWMHPLFLFVYRPAFTRAMSMVDQSNPGAQDPPYFSATLLKVIHAHCARFLNHDVYQNQYHTVLSHQGTVSATLSPTDFMQKMTDEARFGLGMDILKDSSIPTIQALLQQSAREIVFARNSQAWTFAGTAFRMALDMGIHLPTDKLQSFVKCLTPEDIEIRQRLFWSCYTWDKILSLYLGRMPGFTPNTNEVPLTFLDSYSDTDLWSPYYGETPRPDVVHAPNYPPCPGYVVSCFQQLCKICIILNDLMHNIYSAEATACRDADMEEHSAEAKAASEAPFIRISRDLRDWLINLPPHLRINPDSLPPLAPPTHIMSLNLLYHTTVILLNRPVILGARDINAPGPSRSYQVCVQATAAIHDLIMLQGNTFGLSHVSYLNAYAVYIAATVAVLRFERECQPGEDHAAVAHKIGLNFLLDVLQRAANAMPALERSNAIIRKRMKSALERQRSQKYHIKSNSSTPPQFNIPTPTSQQIDLAQPTVFQTLSNPALVQASYPDSSSSFVAPIQWTSGMRTGLYSEPTAVAEDFLPAFPGQQFPVGSEHSFRGGEVDPHARAALLGYNLDPHPRLNSGDIDWGFMDETYAQPGMHM